MTRIVDAVDLSMVCVALNLQGLHVGCRVMGGATPANYSPTATPCSLRHARCRPSVPLAWGGQETDRYAQAIAAAECVKIVCGVVQVLFFCDRRLCIQKWRLGAFVNVGAFLRRTAWVAVSCGLVFIDQVV